MRAVVSSNNGVRGYSSLLWPESLYFPSPAEISIIRLAGLMEKAMGISGNVFKVSTRILAGMAMLPVSSDLSGCMVARIVVSRSDAVMVNDSSDNSK